MRAHVYTCTYCTCTCTVHVYACVVAIAEPGGVYSSEGGDGPISQGHPHAHDGGVHPQVPVHSRVPDSRDHGEMVRAVHMYTLSTTPRVNTDHLTTSLKHLENRINFHLLVIVDVTHMHHLKLEDSKFTHT